MEIASIMTRKTSRDILGNWVDWEILRTVYAFAHEGGLDYTLIFVGSSSNWECFPQMERKEYVANIMGV